MADKPNDLDTLSTTPASDRASADAGIDFGPFALGADAQRRPGVLPGTNLDFVMPESRAYPKHTHRWSLYVPATGTDRPLPCMIFQDGPLVRRYWHVDTVLDNLIAAGDVPPLAAIFVESGHAHGTDPDDQAARNLTRSIEYDMIDDRYARFLIDDILPQVMAHVALDPAPGACGIAGASSGAICAFNAAWHRPDRFQKVFSAIGSFVDIRGGGAYPAIVRAADAKPIRIFLQEGTRDKVAAYPDLDWPAGNRAMAEALSSRGYDYRVAWGDGGHDLEHSAAIFPDALRWLWRDVAR